MNDYDAYIQLYYEKDENRFMDENGDIVHDIYGMVSPEDLCVIRHTFDSDNGYGYREDPYGYGGIIVPHIDNPRIGIEVYPPDKCLICEYYEVTCWG